MSDTAPGRAGLVLVVGSVNLDHVVRVELLPGAGSTVPGDSYRTAAGGKGANQAVSAARQGAPVAMVARVGDDEPGRDLRRVLADEGIDVDAVTTAAEPTGVALITVAGDGSNTIVVAAGANGSLTPAHVAATGAAAPAVVLTQLEVPLDSVRAALVAGRAAGALTVLNPAPAPRSLPADLPALVDVLVPNETEAATLTGASSDDPEGAATALLAAGYGAVVVTLGARGALVARAGQDRVVVPSHPVRAVDTTAAGDAFCGALVTELAAGTDLVAAVRRAVAAGALATTVEGALPSIPDRRAVDRLLTT